MPQQLGVSGGRQDAAARLGGACLAEGAPNQVWGLVWAHTRGSKAPGQAEGGRVGEEGLSCPLRGRTLLFRSE